MRIISTRRIKEYYEREPRSKVALLYWVAVVKRAEWRNAMDVKKDFATVDAIGKQRYVFNIGGNKYIGWSWSCSSLTNVFMCALWVLTRSTTRWIV